MTLQPIDRHLLRVYFAACARDIPNVIQHGKASISAGATPLQLLATVRHLVVLAGYGIALVSTKALRAEGLLPSELDVPGKAGGEEGNAFEMVYFGVRDRLWSALYDTVDPYLSELIRTGCYGDVYSSPGISLKLKQLMAAGFMTDAGCIAEAEGHALAALRFGASLDELLEAANECKIVFESAHATRVSLDNRNEEQSGLSARSAQILHNANDRFQRLLSSQKVSVDPFAEVTCPEGTIRVPSKPAPLT